MDSQCRRRPVNAHGPMLLVALLGAVMFGCKSSPNTCQKDIADCLRRCDATGADPKAEPGAEQRYDQRGLCEQMCQHCHPEQAQPAPSTARPTYIGNANP